jgi:hypothetical protein
MKNVKIAIAALAVAVSGSVATAGGLNDAGVENTVTIVNDTPPPAPRGSLSGALVPAAVLLLIAGVAAGGGS